MPVALQVSNEDPQFEALIAGFPRARHKWYADLQLENRRQTIRASAGGAYVNMPIASIVPIPRAIPTILFTSAVLLDDQRGCAAKPKARAAAQ